MKMFMETLEGNTRSWYEELPTTSLCSLMDFYSTFCRNFKQNHPYIVLIEIFCGKLDDPFQLMIIYIYDQDLMTDEIEEALLELHFPQKEKEDVCYLDIRVEYQ